MSTTLTIKILNTALKMKSRSKQAKLCGVLLHDIILLLQFSSALKEYPVLGLFVSPSCTHIHVQSAMNSGSLHTQHYLSKWVHTTWLEYIYIYIYYLLTYLFIIRIGNPPKKTNSNMTRPNTDDPSGRKCREQWHLTCPCFLHP